MYISINELKKELYKLKPAEIREILLDLLMLKKIEYIDLTLAYINLMKNKNELTATHERLLVDGLATKYQGIKAEYNDARNSLLMHMQLPSEFIRDIVLKGVSKKAITKEKKFLKEQGIIINEKYYRYCTNPKKEGKNERRKH